MYYDPASLSAPTLGIESLPILELQNLEVSRGGNRILRGINLKVLPGESKVVVGPNGAGKSTLVWSIFGRLKPTSGTLFIDNVDVCELSTSDRAALGLSLVPERRRVFPNLTALENILTGLAGQNSRFLRARSSKELEWVLDRLPSLPGLLDKRAGILSGGQQQLVALARALISQPRLLILDEPSLGLSPMVTETVFECLRNMQNERMGILLVDQFAAGAAALSTSPLVLSSGILQRGAAERELQQTYFGLPESEIVQERAVDND